jgi:hypothetical protein
VLARLAREDRNPLIVVNDTDIRVDPDYLEHVTRGRWKIRATDWLPACPAWRAAPPRRVALLAV